MMAGKKRLLNFESIPNTSNSIFQSKRIFEGSSLDVHRTQQSQPQSIGPPPLDTHRAELSRQHVRALNFQFASWVQSQLQNHPDELWEDGVQDYLDHQSKLKEKFSDIVSWLESNASKGESVFGLGSQNAPTSANTSKGESVFGLSSQGAPKKSIFDTKNNTIKLNKEQASFGIKEQNSFGIKGQASFGVNEPISFGVKEKPTFGAFGTTQSPSWSSGFTNQTPFSFGGNLIAAPKNNDASNDADGDEELQQPSSPSVKKTQEKGIIVVHEVKCKLYVKSSDPADTSPWKDKGPGQLSIKCREGVSKGTKESKPIVLVRNDVGRILLNASIYPGIKTNMQKNSIVAIFHTAVMSESGSEGGESNGVVAQTFLIRLKTEDDRNKLASAIQEHAPSA